MARIQIEDLPTLEKLDKCSMQGIFGGVALLLPAVQAAREAARDGESNTLLVAESYSIGHSYPQK